MRADFDMPPDEFRKWGRRFVDWVAEYLDGVGDYPVMARVAPGEVRASVDQVMPAKGEPAEVLLRDFRSLILPGITHWNHPSFFGYFANSASGPGILGELLAAALNVNAMVWRSSPAATELEEVTLDWLRQFLGLPPNFAGSINDTASVATFHALAAAREKGLPEARVHGLAGAPRGRIYASAEAHSSVMKAAVALGLGRAGTVRPETDAEGRIDPDSLAAAIDRDVAAGRRPLAVVATAGTTSLAAVDPLEAVAAVAKSRGVWLHVDAAYAGVAAGVPRLRPLFRGWEQADSIVVNPHKWLFTPMDCSVLFVRSPADFRAAFSLTPPYLETSEEGVSHLMDQGLALGRRFRALKLWFVMRYFGKEGIRAVLEHHLQLAARLAEAVDRTPGWERRKPSRFSLVVLRCAPGGFPPSDWDALNLAVMERVNRSGVAFLSHNEIESSVWLRFAVGNIRTSAVHVDRAFEAMQEAARAAAGLRGRSS